MTAIFRWEFTYQTDKEYLGELLTEEGLISGGEGPTACMRQPWMAKWRTMTPTAVGGSSPATGRTVSRTSADSLTLHDGDRFT